VLEVGEEAREVICCHRMRDGEQEMERVEAAHVRRMGALRGMAARRAGRPYDERGERQEAAISRARRVAGRSE
jgi:hypothetical protein